jgi:hypothetical protein
MSTELGQLMNFVTNQVMSNVNGRGNANGAVGLDDLFKEGSGFRKSGDDSYIKDAGGTVIKVSQPYGEGTEFMVEVQAGPANSFRFAFDFEQTSPDNFTMNVELPDSGLKLDINYERNAQGKWNIIDVNPESTRQNMSFAEKEKFAEGIFNGLKALENQPAGPSQPTQVMRNFALYVLPNLNSNARADAGIDELFKGSADFKEVGNNRYVRPMADGGSIVVTQPDGKGGELHVERSGRYFGTTEYTVDLSKLSYDNLGAEITLGESDVSMDVNFDRDVQGNWRAIDVNVDAPQMSAADIEKAGAELMQELNDSIAETGKNKRKKGAGADGTSTSTAAPQTGGTEANSGGGGIDLGEGESWFMLLAIAMGNVMNEKATGLKDLLKQIEDAGDEPPFALTARFNALSQELNFMQSAFMNALNSIGATIKGFLEAGGASR